MAAPPALAWTTEPRRGDLERLMAAVARIGDGPANALDISGHRRPLVTRPTPVRPSGARPHLPRRPGAPGPHGPAPAVTPAADATAPRGPLVPGPRHFAATSRKRLLARGLWWARRKGPARHRRPS